MIAIGTQYRVFASNKKSFVEEVVWAKGSFEDGTYQAVTISEVMRNGSYLITPQNEDDVEYLAGGQYQDDDELFEFEVFEEQEFEESYDRYSCDFSFSGNGMTDSLEEQIEDEIYDYDGWRDDYFRENGFEEVEYRTYIIGPVDIENV